jgi:molecular chaperone GrpE
MSGSDSTDTLNTPPAEDAPASGPTPADSLAAAKKEATENYDRYLRSVADELRQYAASRVLEELLPVMDNLALGLAAAKQPGADLKMLSGGMDMVLAQLKTALSNHGLKEINPVGQPFDANLHEAISAQPSAEVAEGRVLNVVRTGYSLNGRLLRPASVVVSSGAAKA